MLAHHPMQDEDGSIKLIDWGYLAEYDPTHAWPTPAVPCGTLEYVAPELMAMAKGDAYVTCHASLDWWVLQGVRVDVREWASQARGAGLPGAIHTCMFQALLAAPSAAGCSKRCWLSPAN